MMYPRAAWALRALAVCAALACWPADALAGTAVRLLVELPPDVQVLGPGDAVPVQVVGLDAAGSRVSFGRRKVVFSVGRGKVTVVERPYSFRYHAPDKVDSAQSIRVKAHLEENPNIQGTVNIRLAPPGRYVRLHLRPASASVRLGGETTVEVLAEKREGGTTPLVDQRVSLAVSGGGSIEFIRLGHYRFRAPTRAAGGTPGQRVKLTASLQNKPNVKGETTLTLLGRREPPPAAPPPEKPPSAPGSGDPGGTDVDAGKGGTNESGLGVSWPSGNIRVAVWRLKETALAEWSPAVKRLPKAGGEFVARTPFQKLRIVVERKDVVRVELEWWIGGKNAARIRRDGPGEQGALTVVRNKNGNYVAHLEGRTPDNHKPLHIDLLLHLNNGKVVREPLVMRRGRDADRDGTRDGR